DPPRLSPLGRAKARAAPGPAARILRAGPDLLAGSAGALRLARRAVLGCPGPQPSAEDLPGAETGLARPVRPGTPPGLAGPRAALDRFRPLDGRRRFRSADPGLRSLVRPRAQAGSHLPRGRPGASLPLPANARSGPRRRYPGDPHAGELRPSTPREDL